MVRVLSEAEVAEAEQYVAETGISGWVCDIVGRYEGPGTEPGYPGAHPLVFGEDWYWLMMSREKREQSLHVGLYVSKKGQYDKIVAEFSPEDLADWYTLALAMADLLEQLSASIVHNKAVVAALKGGAGVVRRVVKTMREKQSNGNQKAQS